MQKQPKPSNQEDKEEDEMEDEEDVVHAIYDDDDEENPVAEESDDDDEDKDDDAKDDNGEDNPVAEESDDNDIHGIASQLMISDESDFEENRQTTRARSNQKGDNRSHGEQGDNSSTQKGANNSRQQKKRGKAIVHRDGRIERRGKRTTRSEAGCERSVAEQGHMSESDGSSENVSDRRRGGRQKSKLDSVDDVLSEYINN